MERFVSARQVASPNRSTTNQLKPIHVHPINRSDPIRCNSTQSNPAQSYPIQFSPVQSNPIHSNSIQSSQVRSYPLTYEPGLQRAQARSPPPGKPHVEFPRPCASARRCKVSMKHPSRQFNQPNETYSTSSRLRNTETTRRRHTEWEGGIGTNKVQRDDRFTSSGRIQTHPSAF